jgi:subtilisin family serine protease
LAAIERQNGAGILFVAAAGNGACLSLSHHHSTLHQLTNRCPSCPDSSLADGLNTDISVNYPSCYSVDNIVGAVGRSGGLAWFSNYGNTTVDLFAPGVDIVSTYPSSEYRSQSGTSMATPHVTGAVALYAAAHKRATGVMPTAAAIKAAVMATGTTDPAYEVSGVTKAAAGLLPVAVWCVLWQPQTLGQCCAQAAASVHLTM